VLGRQLRAPTRRLDRSGPALDDATARSGYGFGVSVPGQSCRAAAGPCDVAEACDGFNALAPRHLRRAGDDLRPQRGRTATLPKLARVLPPPARRRLRGHEPGLPPGGWVCDRAETCSGTARTALGMDSQGKTSVATALALVTRPKLAPAARPTAARQLAPAVRSAGRWTTPATSKRFAQAPRPTAGRVFAPAEPPATSPRTRATPRKPAREQAFSAFIDPDPGAEAIWRERSSERVASDRQRDSDLKGHRFLAPRRAGPMELGRRFQRAATTGCPVSGEYRVFFSSLECGESSGYWRTSASMSPPTRRQTLMPT
jgi:hypothetical protein